eukprot:TRINITY_DN1706_c0_g2_i2.p1 TRINITY_DN1706_c0_g2~~TRINITY_DN1706_c0_g2_i2.p1  ORF type:complete len:233 (-),score=35.72 TRINITY_DN1706_c0_g2_i2:1618-2316(-)
MGNKAALKKTPAKKTPKKRSQGKQTDQVSYLEELLRDVFNAQREDMFTEHFLACMVQMTEDISVAVAGIDLSYKLARLDILTEKDIDNLYGLVSDFNRKIKYEVAKFINDYFLETVVTNKTKSKIASSRKVTPDHPKFLATSKILALLDLIENNTSHKNLPDYVVDALWGQTEILTYWEVMTDLMLNPGDKMAGSDYVLLAKFLSVCIKREAAEDVVPRNKMKICMLSHLTC